MNGKRRILAVFLVLGLLLAPSGASATGIPVVDIIAWVQRILAYIKQLEQIRNEALHLELAYKQAKNFANGGHWSDLSGLLGAIDQIFAFSTDADLNLGYLRADVENVFRETFPGYSTPTPGAFPAQNLLQLGRARETLAKILSAQNRITWNDTGSQIKLAEMTADAQSADTPIKAAQAGAMLQSLQVTELQKMLQANLLSANAVTMGVALNLQKDASATSARNFFLASGAGAPSAGYDPTQGYTGIPSSAPSSIF